MKRFLSLFLVAVLVISTLAIFTACDSEKNNGQQENEVTTTAATTTVATTTVATTAKPEPVIPKGYKLYTGKVVSFAYPETWELYDEDGIVMMQEGESGNNVNLVEEPKTDIYDKLTIEQFNSEFKPFYEELGMSVSNVKLERKEVNGINVTILSFKTSIESISMNQTQYIFTEGDLTYSVTITEVTADAALALNVLNSLSVKK